MTALAPDWPAPANIVARVSCRHGGGSAAPYDSLNLALHVGDVPATVEHNRAAWLGDCPDLRAVQWLRQVHGTHVVDIEQAADEPLAADAAITSAAGLGCVVLTADCLPILLCDRAGRQVAAVHAGWRGLQAGILPAAVARFAAPAAELLAWIGPCIRQPHFEVGPEVRERFLDRFASLPGEDIERCFAPSPRRGHYLCDLATLAAGQMRSLGLASVSDSGLCTFEDPRFYSYRKEGRCGRFASLIYRRTP